MNAGATMESRQPRWRFYLGWVAVSAASIPIAGLLAWTIITLVEEVMGSQIEVGGRTHITEDFLFSWVFFPLLGLLMGCLQYLILRRHVPRIGAWISATVVGWTLSLAVVRLVFGSAGWRFDAAVMAALLGGAVALPQWWVLRRRVRHAGWWLVAGCLGWGLAGLITGQTILISFEAIVAGLMPAVAAGLALWLLLDRLPRRDAASVAPGA